MSEWKWFDKNEMKCKHCGKCEMNEEFMNALDMARDLAGIPIVITSGYRCEEHDNTIRGDGNHPQGRAADIRAENSYERAKVITGLIKAGFQRIGIGIDFVHVDDCPNRPRPCMFLYLEKGGK